MWCRGQKPPTLMPTDCSVLRTPTILPNIRISWDYHPTFMLISGRVLRSFTHLWASSCGLRPFDPGISYILYLLFDGAFIFVDSHPALYFLLKFRLCWEKLFWHEGKFSDLKSLISDLAVAWAVHWQGAFRRHFAQLVKERKQECLCTSVSTFLLQVVNGLR